jgi:hypothetical protein
MLEPLDEIIAGLTLAKQYGGSVSGEHDEIHISLTSAPTREERAKLKAIGWTSQDSTNKWWMHFV